MRVLVVVASMAAVVVSMLAIAMLPVAFSMVAARLAVQEPRRMCRYVSADRIACRSGIDNRKTEMHASPDACEICLVSGG